ncbi:MAG: hypothetical protein NVS4B3_21680 [Gemmatimonadaceae bacterium]
MDADSIRPAKESETHVDASPTDFERVTLPYLGDIARFARSLTRDATRADDLVQETFLQALRGWHTFRANADARPWLFALCHHAFLRTVRREALYVEAPDDDPELESFATALAHQAAARGAVVDALERIDLRSAINAALDHLPPHFRGCVVLIDVEGQTYEEAGAILRVPVGTVRSRLFRGRRLLQDLLFEHACDAGLRVPRDEALPPRSVSPPVGSLSDRSLSGLSPDHLIASPGSVP